MKHSTKTARFTSIILGMLILMLAQLTPIQATESLPSNSTEMAPSSAQCLDGYNNSVNENSGYNLDSLSDYSDFCVTERYKQDGICILKNFYFTIDDYLNCTYVVTYVDRFPSDPDHCPAEDNCPALCGL